MALFSINRYMGDEEDLGSRSSKSKAADILEKIKQQAEERKQQRLSPGGEKSPKTSDIKIELIKSAKKTVSGDGESVLKRHKALESDSHDDTPQKKTKKKHKKVEIVEVQDKNIDVDERRNILFPEKDGSRSEKETTNLRKLGIRTSDLDVDDDFTNSDESEAVLRKIKKRKKKRKTDEIPENEQSVVHDSEHKLEDSVCSHDNLMSGESESSFIKSEKRKKKKKTNEEISENEQSVLHDTENKLEDSLCSHDNLMFGESECSLKKSEKRKKKKKTDDEISENEQFMPHDSKHELENSACSHDSLMSGKSESILKKSGKKKKKSKVVDTSQIEGSELNDSEERDKSKKIVDFESENAGVDENANRVTQEGSHEVGGFTILGDFKQKSAEKVRRVLPDWLASPSVIHADLRHQQVPVEEMKGLDEKLVRKLAENQITHFFPVQLQVIPVLLDTIRHGFCVGPAGYRPNDICVSAPTGSGKTLAFVLPVVQALKDRVSCKVRAVVVLPVRDLAFQVFKVFQTYSEGTKLKVGLAAGQQSFYKEQSNLVKESHRGYLSLADIVVATPGRLVDHIVKTEGFDLTFLRFLVIDEADRMMDDIKQNWLSVLESAVYNKKEFTTDSVLRKWPGPLTVSECIKMKMPLQKMLFSATLSQNPEQLQQLNLFQPRLYTSTVRITVKEEQRILKALSSDDVEDKGSNEDHLKTVASPAASEGEFVGKYITPAGLTEYYIQSSPAEKPLLILHFLHELKFRQVLCFTNSLEATHRLYWLVKLVGNITVKEFSSGLHPVRRNKILRQFGEGKVDLIICSDAMARGMDIENVKYVISYNAPVYIKTYIHRIGRTARAGKAGTAFTLLEKKEIFHFKKMVKDAGKTKVKEMMMTRQDLKPMIPQFTEALKRLPEVLKAEVERKKHVT